MAQLARADFQERKVKGLNLVRKGACKSEKCERPIKGRRELIQRGKFWEIKAKASLNFEWARGCESRGWCGCCLLGRCHVNACACITQAGPWGSRTREDTRLINRARMVETRMLLGVESSIESSALQTRKFARVERSLDSKDPQSQRECIVEGREVSTFLSSLASRPIINTWG